MPVSDEINQSSGDQEITADQFCAPRWWRHRWKIVVVLAIALAIWPGREMWALFWAVPAPDESHLEELNELQSRYSVEGENALPLYLAANARHQEIAESLGLAIYRNGEVSGVFHFAMEGLKYLNAETWDDSRLESAVAIFEAFKPSIDMFAEAARASTLIVPFDRESLQSLGLDSSDRLLHPMRDRSAFSFHLIISRLRGGLRLGITAAAIEDDWSRALDLTEAALLGARQFTQLPCIEDWYRGKSIYVLAGQAWCEILHSRDLPVDVCEDVRDLFERLPFPGHPHERWIEGERVRELALLDWTHSKMGLPVIWAERRDRHQRTSNAVTWSPTLSDRFDNMYHGLRIPGRDVATLQINDFFDQLVEYSRVPDEERIVLELPSIFGDRIHPIREHRKKIGDDQRGVGYTALGNANRLNNLLAKSAIRLRNQLQITLALEIFHAEHGRWPESLDELSLAPESIRDPDTNEPFEYQRLDGGELSLLPAYAELYSTMDAKMHYLLGPSDDRQPGPPFWPWPPMQVQIDNAMRELDPAKYIGWSDASHPDAAKLSP